MDTSEWSKLEDTVFIRYMFLLRKILNQNDILSTRMQSLVQTCTALLMQPVTLVLIVLQAELYFYVFNGQDTIIKLYIEVVLGKYVHLAL